ncbi:PH domain-containing protein [Mycena kentingensis (nom. inval.)]|nr:PH domain-containing protein [Mycena kentingensis (nom. inval.)]
MDGSSPTHNRSSSFFNFNNRRATNTDAVPPQRSQSFLSRQRMDSQPQSPPPQRASLEGPPVASALLHPEIRSVVQLTTAHARKIYFSGPLIRRIERQPDGQKPVKDEGWTEVWAQLGGTTLSIWDMKAVQEASAQGREVPPTYLNITDAFVHVLGAVTVPETPSSPAKRYPDVLTINTGGSNLLLFSCPSTQALLSWAAALRLSAWEKSRLEEIYTAHLLRITLSGRDHPSTLQNGRMEGWVRVRIAGQTDWKKVWMSVCAAADAVPAAEPQRSKKRMSNLFSSKDHPPVEGPLPSRPLIAIYAGPKPKDRRKPLLTVHNISQAFAVYPERPDLISRSTLIKLEGLIGDEDTAGEMARREGWLLVMPELEGGLGQAEEMLKWVVAFHDAFQLYGRPQGWSWDPRDPNSQLFAYPVGPKRDLLFLEREAAEVLDVRDDRTSSIRSRLTNILHAEMPDRVPGPPPQNAGPPQQPQRPLDGPPSLPPIGGISNGAPAAQNLPPTSSPLANTQLPPLAFGSENNAPPRQSPPPNHLSPISERSTGPSVRHNPSASVDSSSVLSPQRRSTLNNGNGPPAQDRAISPTGQTHPSILDNAPLTQSPKSSFESGPAPPGKDAPSAYGGSNAGNSIRMVQKSGSIPSATLSPVEPVNRGMNHSPTSVLTSPHSINDLSAASRSMSQHSSVLTSPFSNTGHSSPPAPAAEDNTNFMSEAAGALYYMQQFDSVPRQKAPPRQQPTTISEGDDESEEEEEAANATATTGDDSYGPSSPVVRQATPTAFQQQQPPRAQAASPTQSSLTSTGSSQYAGLGRKPSGARAPNTTRGYRGPDRGISTTLSSSAPSEPLTEEDSQSERSMRINHSPSPPPPARSNEDLDALAALSYLAVNDDQQNSQPAYDGMQPVAPLRPHAAERVASTSGPAERTATPPSEYKSSFAPSKQAAKRKAKIEAQQAAHNAAVHRPGRANGRKRSKIADRGGWGESSDEEEEEEEEEEDDDDVDSDGEPAPVVRKPLTPSTSSGPASVDHASSRAPPSDEPGQTYSHLRPPRTLPQPPPRPFAEAEGMQPRRLPSDFSDAGRRTYLDDGTQLRSQAEMPQPGASAARQSMWSQVLDPGRSGALPGQNSDTFVQLEDNKLTKAFTPQGLLSAGMQDKADRSAKRQEEIARESGASLINVPNKPPPPQVGLLGAITAHERERKREGGVGAALTEREREKRVAEDRQRRFDEQQKQQLDQMQQGQSMYGGQFPAYNPMMMGMPMMPMMTGQMPMMTGQMPMQPMMTGGYPGMYNPQHMYAAQQAAAQAYQQAMVAFSTAGSQVGGEGGGGPSPGNANSQMNPHMNPMMSGMGMYDPRMSMAMMGMPMMSPQMSGMGMMNPQMTGMSQFDPRFGPSNGSPGMEPLAPPMGLPGQYPSRTSSPARGSPHRGSPLIRPVDHNEGGGAGGRSRPTSPRPS